MSIRPNILYFVTEANFIELQKTFLAYDDRGTHDENKFVIENVIHNDFDIIHKSFDSDNNDNYETIFFYNDFLPTIIYEIAEFEINLIKNSLTKFQYNDHERKNFINHQIQLYNDYENKIFGNLFLGEDIRARLHTQTSQILEFLFDDDSLKNLFASEDKMKINLNKNEIQILFFLLRQAKLIDHTQDSDLGRCIDNFFLYYNSKTTEHKEIKKSNKDLSDYRNYNKTAQKAIVRLKAIFSDENFYNIKV